MAQAALQPQAERTVLSRADGPCHIITLNRPERLNAFSMDVHRDIKIALDAAEADPACRVVILTGAGRGFCAGQDLSSMPPPGAGAERDTGHLIDVAFNPLVKRIKRFPVPVVAAVNGTAAGGGANIALACDIVVAAHSASFLQAFAKIALIPDCGGTYFLPRIVGSARARGLAMLAQPVSAKQAAEWGLIWSAVADDTLMAEAHAVATRLASLPTGALIATRQALDAAETNSLDQQLDLERDLQRACGKSPDFGEGVQAFLEKRPARFSGRN